MSLINVIRLLRPVELATGGIHLQVEFLCRVQLRVAENMLSFWYIAGDQMQQPVDFLHFSALRSRNLQGISTVDLLRGPLYNSHRRRDVPWREIEEQEPYNEGDGDYWPFPDSIHGHGCSVQEYK